MSGQHEAFIRRGLMKVASGLLFSISVWSCSRAEKFGSSEPLSLVSRDLSEQQIASALKASMAIRINLKSNRATFYRDGKAVQQWNVATADITGRYHGGEPQVTPEGIFRPEFMEHCPVWRPRDVINPATGELARTDDERWDIFSSHLETYGPCGERNPLGRYVFWFQGPYGLHGNAAEKILQLSDPEERRVSGGCIRNPNARIKEFFHSVLNNFSALSSFKKSVEDMEVSERKATVSTSVKDIDFRVVVGRWGVDPSVSDSDQSDGGPQSVPLPVGTPVATPAPFPTTSPIPGPVGPVMICKAVAVDDTSHVAPVHRTLPATKENISAFYRMSDPIRVQGIIPGTDFYLTGRGYIEKRFVGNCSKL